MQMLFSLISFFATTSILIYSLRNAATINQPLSINIINIQYSILSYYYFHNNSRNTFLMVLLYFFTHNTRLATLWETFDQHLQVSWLKASIEIKSGACITLFSGDVLWFMLTLRWISCCEITFGRTSENRERDYKSHLCICPAVKSHVNGR